MGKWIYNAGLNIFDTQLNEEGKPELKIFELNEFKYFSKPKEYENTPGTLYMRAGLRYRLIDNVYIQVSGRTFVHAFDCAEFGIGYSIPYSTSRGGRFGGRTGRYGGR